MPDNDFDALNEDTWASASRQANAPGSIVPEFSDDTIFRATQRIPRVVDAVAPAHAHDLADPTPRRLVPEETGPDRRSMVLVLLVAVAALATLIGWPLLDRRPTVPTAVPPRASATVSIHSTSPLPSASTTTVTTRPAPPPPTPVPIPTVTAVVTVEVTAPPTSATPTPSPSPSATPTASASPSVSVSPSASPTPSPSPTATTPPFPVSTWSFTFAGLGPISLGMPTASALTAGYLVEDATAPSGYVTAPALGAGLRLNVSGGVISAITVTDASVRSAEGAGVGTPLTTLSTAYGTALVTLAATDAAGLPVGVPGLDSPTAYVAFAPTTGVVSTVYVGLKQPDGTIVLP